ncbi:MAG TPA: hypothetical protein VG146_17675 [Verrucomicrobiae bacterium]|nr:hypothetical protein [Verrucomicrobiae bacterium]
MFGLFNLGGGEIILVLTMLFILIAVAAVLAGIISLIIRMATKAKRAGASTRSSSTGCSES